MEEVNSRKKQAKFIRVIRKVHRLTAIFLFVFFVLISISGILLGWKKHSAGFLLAKTQLGTSSDLKKWLPMDSLYTNATIFLHDSVSVNLSNEIEKIDVRKEKGVVKFIFKDHFWGLQLDGATGKLLKIERRRSDFIEKLHDGSIIDDLIGWKGGTFKLIYTTITGFALLLFSITGFWLWYGPKKMMKTVINH